MDVKQTTGTLTLADGNTFTGTLHGIETATSGEVVFLTGMTGYPEALTDPSFAGQILVFTYPLIGNYGVPLIQEYTDVLASPFESKKIWVAGVVVQNVYDDTDHADAEVPFRKWLAMHNVPLLSGIDTRALTKHLRESGTMLGAITAGNKKMVQEKWYDPNVENIVAKVSCAEPFTVGEGKHKITLIDCGAKWNIIRELVKRDCTVRVVPWDYNPADEAADGYIISNGPGDPTQCVATIKHARSLLTGTKPVFGICLGNQILALAAGAKTAKMPYGHRSQNQPCVDVTTGRCYITTQNHGFHVQDKSLPKGWHVWFTNNNDGTNEGIRHATKPFRSVQFHPESHPGPHDTAWLFDDFVKIYNV